jgi:spore maturation protein CgeB
MKILVVSMLHDYGDKARGLSGSQYYFEQPIERVGNQVLSFDFMTEFHELGRERMNQALLELVRREQPDITLVVPYTDQFIPEVIRQIRQHTSTVAYLWDDPWRVSYSRFLAGHFDFVTTSDVNGVRRLREAGYENAVYSPFGCNTHLFQERSLPKLYDVTFVGQYHPYRAWLFGRLREAGVALRVWGHGWPAGHIGLSSMIDVFNQSKISLNMTNCVSWDLRYLSSSLRAVKDTLNSLRLRDPKTREMVKARHFEINACGGFQLSYYSEGLERFYRIGEEIAIYASPAELVEKVNYYLKHDAERESIAHCGFERTIAEHTLEHRYRQLFSDLQEVRRT